MGEFRCKNGRCVPSERTCDGRDNCFDNSDEESPCGKDFKYTIQYTINNTIEII